MNTSKINCKYFVCNKNTGLFTNNCLEVSADIPCRTDWKQINIFNGEMSGKVSYQKFLMEMGILDQRLFK